MGTKKYYGKARMGQAKQNLGYLGILPAEIMQETLTLCRIEDGLLLSSMSKSIERIFWTTSVMKALFRNGNGRPRNCLFNWQDLPAPLVSCNDARELGAYLVADGILEQWSTERTPRQLKDGEIEDAMTWFPQCALLRHPAIMNRNSRAVTLILEQPTNDVRLAWLQAMIMRLSWMEPREIVKAGHYLALARLEKTFVDHHNESAGKDFPDSVSISTYIRSPHCWKLFDEDMMVHFPPPFPYMFSNPFQWLCIPQPFSPAIEVYREILTSVMNRVKSEDYIVTGSWMGVEQNRTFFVADEQQVPLTIPTPLGLEAAFPDTPFNAKRIFNLSRVDRTILDEVNSFCFRSLTLQCKKQVSPVLNSRGKFYQCQGFIEKFAKPVGSFTTQSDPYELTTSIWDIHVSDGSTFRNPSYRSKFSGTLFIRDDQDNSPIRNKTRSYPVSYENNEFLLHMRLESDESLFWIGVVDFDGLWGRRVISWTHSVDDFFQYFTHLENFFSVVDGEHFCLDESMQQLNQQKQRPSVSVVCDKLARGKCKRKRAEINNCYTNHGKAEQRVIFAPGSYLTLWKDKSKCL